MIGISSFIFNSEKLFQNFLFLGVLQNSLILNPFTYTFHPITRCSMCHASVNDSRILGKRMNQTQGFSPHKKVGISITVMQCKKCGLIYSNPMPLPNKLDDHYGVPPESYWKEEYFKVDPTYFSGEIAWLNRLRKIQKGQRSLDIGAGIGKQMIALAAVGFDVHGLEPSEPFYRRAIEKMGIQKDKLLLSDIEHAEFKSDFFDFISFGAVLEHLYDPSMALNKAINWLKPSGVLHMEVPNSKWLISRILNIQYRFRGLDYVTNLSPMHQPFHLYEFSFESFVENGRINHYKVADHGYYVCESYMPGWLDFFIKPYMKTTNTGMQLCVWLTK